MSRSLMIALFLLLVTNPGVTLAQGPPGQPPGTPAPGQPPTPAPAPAPSQKTPRPTQATTPQPVPAAVAVTPKPRGRSVNLQVEVTITDQMSGGEPERKVVSMMVADATMGRIRASATARPSVDIGYVGTGLNVDAFPTMLPDDKILLQLTIEYSPFRGASTEGRGRPTELHESLSVILDSGRSLMVSQAADPISDRRMTVEVKATIVK